MDLDVIREVRDRLSDLQGVKILGYQKRNLKNLKKTGEKYEKI
jgi:hypothetical protein